MSSSQKARLEEIVDTTQEVDTHGQNSDSEADNDVVGDGEELVGAEENQPSTSQKKKKKKKKKGKSEVPQALVNEVLKQVKETNGPGVSEEVMRMTLERLEIMNVAKGKVGLGGKNKKDMGEHKVCTACCIVN